jgi:hypothetical protein
MTQIASSQNAQLIYFSHGGGPLPILIFDDFIMGKRSVAFFWE